MLKIGSAYKVSTGTLTVRNVSNDGKNKTVSAWYESSVGDEYSHEVKMSEENFKKTVIRRI